MAQAPTKSVSETWRFLARKRGQAALEYMLLVAISLLIFGAMFYAIRQAVFRLWICEITPRIQGASGCNFSDRPCYPEPAEATEGARLCRMIAP